ncbi:MAG: DUF4430 domain-containing protein [Patescibacteria group bacterium]
MNSKQNWQIVGIGLLVIALAIGIFIYTGKTIPSENNINQEVTQTSNISLTIEGLYSSKSISISEKETVLKILQTLNSENPQLKLSTKEYSGLGVLVESMNGNKNGTDDKYWQYKVNAVMPQIGADKLELKNGDSVEWYFSKSEF